MTKDKWEVSTFGNDCLGNITGYRVTRYCARRLEIAGAFCGNIYVPGSFGKAMVEAEALADRLNSNV
jgi:hypothetical protein